MAKVKLGYGNYIETPDNVTEEQAREGIAEYGAKEDAAFRAWAQMAGQDPDKLTNPTYAREQWKKSSAYSDFVKGTPGALDSGQQAPGAPGTLAPDLTDEALKKVRRAMAVSLLTKQGRASSFLTGPGGMLSMAGPAQRPAMAMNRGVNFGRLGMRLGR